MGFGIARAGQNKDTLPLSTAGLLCGWHCGDTCHGHFAVGHCRGTPRLGTAGKLGAWAPPGVIWWFLHCRDTWGLGTAEILGAWALQGYLVVGHCKDTWRLGAAGILGGWAAGYCKDARWLGTARILGG